MGVLVKLALKSLDFRVFKTTSEAIETTYRILNPGKVFKEVQLFNLLHSNTDSACGLAPHIKILY